MHVSRMLKETIIKKEPSKTYQNQMLEMKMKPYDQKASILRFCC